MEYLEYFSNDYNNNKINVNDYYNYNNQSKIYDYSISDNKVSDVITDLTNHNKPLSMACIPFAKQIITSNQIKCKIPQLGDLFIGIKNHPIINNVTFIINNFTEVIEIAGYLNSDQIWILTNLPIPLICINDYDNIYLEVCIDLKSHKKIHTQPIFKAYYGYFKNEILYHLIKHAVYEIPLSQSSSILKIVCGLWTVT